MAERGFLGSARIVGACTLTSRVLGMVRDILCASFFGASPEWDAFVIAFIIPNLFRRLFGEGALTAAFVPVFVHRLEKEGKPSATRLLRSLVGILSIVLLIFVALGIGISYLIPYFSAAPKLALICEYLRLMLPYLFFICLAAIFGAALNSLGHFFAPAFAPVTLNVVWVASILLIAPSIPVVIGAVLVGGLIEMVIQIPPLLRKGVPPSPQFNHREKGLREVGLLFFPVVFGLALVQINEVADNLIAEVCVPGDGAVSILYYANRLMQLPLAVVGTALATAAFPRLSAQAANEDPSGFGESVRHAMHTCFFLAIPASVGLALLAIPIIQLLFEHGKFGLAETIRTQWVLIFFAIGITAYSMNQILVRAFYARKEMKVPVRVSAVMVFANIALNLILVWRFEEAGLALSTAVTGTATTFILFALLRRQVPTLQAHVAPVLIRTLLLSAAMAAAVMGADAWLQQPAPDDTILRSFRLAALVGIGMGIYFGLARAWKFKRFKN